MVLLLNNQVSTPGKGENTNITINIITFAIKKGSPVHKAPAYAGSEKGSTIWCIVHNLTLFFTQEAVSMT